MFVLAAVPAGAAKKKLDLSDMTADPPIAGRAVTGLTWLPDSQSFSYVVRKGSGEEETSELWIEEARSGHKRVAIPASALTIAADSTPAPSGNIPPEKPGRLSLESYSWSPDGQSVLLSGVHDLWLYRLDGRGLTRLTRSGEDEEFPAFSPDGRRIAFVRSHRAAKRD
jgi:dipeptidyl aminopeptidase/acylaminoacyl peptidase